MDGDQAQGGFVEAGLAQIPAALQAVVEAGDLSEIGRASCRERVCHNV